MPDQQFPKRKSPRLKDYDYTQSGAYFVTICTYQRRHLFGQVTDDKMVLSSLGKLAHWHWQDLTNHIPNIILDLFVVMPNHVHGIVFKTDDIDVVPTVDTVDKRSSLGVIIGSFKAAVTRNARKKLNFSGKIWQQGYHDHIIRNEKRLNFIRQYIFYNPAKWSEDRYYESQ